MEKAIREAERDIPVLDEVDVLVAGAGVAGCSAALAAARSGARTMLVERNGCLGGVATAGLMANIGNRYMDENGRVSVTGIPKEVIERLVERRGASEKWACREVPGIVIDSEQLKVLLIEMLQEAGVEVLTHALAARPILEQRAVAGAFIESKSGRQAVTAKAVIDTTGEADLAHHAGCAVAWRGGSASLEFKMGRVNLDALYQHFKRHPETFPVGRDMVRGFAEFERNWVERGIFFFPHGGGKYCDIFQNAVRAGEFQTERGILYDLDAAGLYGLRHLDSVIVNSNFYRVENLDVRDLSKAELETQQACYYVADFFRKKVPGFEKAYIVQLATDLGIRTSRVLEGCTALKREHVESAAPVYFDDVIGCVPARASFKRDGAFHRSHDFDVPFGTILPKDGLSLLVASGKTACTEPLGLIRGMCTCMLLGQAAGVAAALAARDGVSTQDVGIRAIQKVLLEQGVFLGPRDRLRALSLG